MGQKNYPFYKVRRITTLQELVGFRAEETGSEVVFRYKEEGELREVTYAQLRIETEAVGAVLYGKGYHDGIKMGILGENSYEWLLAFFAITGGGNVAVPLDKELSVTMLDGLISDSGCQVLFYSDSYREVAEKIKGVYSGELELVSLSSLKGLSGAEKKAEYRADTIQPEDVAAIVYTSGTTGQSKGVVLTHGNLALDTYLACRNILFAGDTILLLPLHHTFGLTAGVLVTMLYGHAVYINKSLRNLAEDLQIAKPRTLFLVPLFVESVYKSVLVPAIEAGAGAKVFGGKLNMIVSGGAPLARQYLEGYEEQGIQLINGYGITECSPVVAVNRNDFDKTKDGSVGMVLEEIEVRVDEPDMQGEGEICVKGPVVMQGYYHMEQETADVIQDGWFHTGDIGYVDEDNFLFITGRKKNLIILENGENISPEALEQRVQEIQLVREVVVYGENGHLVAEIYPDDMYQEEQGISDIYQELKQQINELNKVLPSYQNIREVRIRDTEFPKTTTKKIKR